MSFLAFLIIIDTIADLFKLVAVIHMLILCFYFATTNYIQACRKEDTIFGKYMFLGKVFLGKLITWSTSLSLAARLKWWNDIVDAAGCRYDDSILRGFHRDRTSLSYCMDVAQLRTVLS